MKLRKWWIGLLAMTLTLVLALGGYADTFNGQTVTPLTLGTEVNAVIEKAGEYAYFSYTPTATEMYAFYSGGDQDTYGYIYDSNQNELDVDDDGGEGNNFRIRYTLEKEKTYYFGARFYSSENTGTFPVTLEKYTGIVAKRVGEENRIVKYGETETLAVTASSGHGEVKYQWYKEGQKIEGATSASYDIESVTEENYYFCRVSDNTEESEDLYFWVKVNNMLTARAVLGEIMVSVGENATMQVSASCLKGEMTYQWFKQIYNEDQGTYNSVEIENAISNNYALQGITEAARYYCRVSDQFGNTSYVYFQIRIDNGFSATRIGDYIVYAELGEAATLGVNATCNTGELTYTWQYYVDGPGYKTIGDSSDTLTTDPVQTRRDYRCIVRDNYGNETSVSYAVCVQNGLTMRSLTPNPKIQEDDTATLRVSATCNRGNVTYQWYKSIYDAQNGYYRREKIIGATGDSYTVQNASPGDEFACTATDQYGNMYDWSFKLSKDNLFKASAAGETDFTIQLGESVTMKVEASCRDGSITYQWSEFTYNPTDGYWHSSILENADSAQYTAGSLDEARQYKCIIRDEYGNYEEIWFYVYIENGLQINRAGDYTVYAPYGGTATLSVSASCRRGKVKLQWYEEVYNGRYYTRKILPGETGTTLTINNVTELKEYVCEAWDQYNNTASCWIEVTVDNEFNVERTGEYVRTVRRGQNVTLGVTATCKTGNLTYQWYKGYAAEAIEGANAASYTVPNVGSSGVFFCRVSDIYQNTRNIEVVVVVPEQATPLTLGNTVSAQLETGSMVLYSFKPSQSGSYLLNAAPENGYWAETYVFDSTWYNVAYASGSEDFSNRVRLLKDVQYYIGVCYGEESGNLPVTLMLNENQTFETLSVGLKVGQKAVLPVLPGAVEITAVTSSNTAVVSVNNKELTAKKAGTAVLTVTCSTTTLKYNVTVYTDTGTIRVPANLTEIGDEAFAGDGSVRFVELGSKVSWGGENAFGNSGLIQIVVNNESCWFAENAFSGTAPTMIVPDESSPMYYAIQNGIEYLLLP